MPNHQVGLHDQSQLKHAEAERPKWKERDEELDVCGSALVGTE
jgi:hypothetical protein